MGPSPKLSYRIWFTPRSGSTMLCKALEQTQVAGKPQEFFNVPSDGTLLKMHQAEDYPALRAHLWRTGSSENGVFGIKHSQFTSRYQQLLGELSSLRGIDVDSLSDHEVFWADLFPNVRHIYLTRRNKVRQAVSWWRAIKTEEWHLQPGQQRKALSEDWLQEQYDFAALRHLFTEAALRECAIEAYFATHQIKPLTVVYEDLCRDYQKELQRILDFLKVEYTVKDKEHTHYQRTSDEYSAHWVQQFRQDLQADWSHQAW